MNAKCLPILRIVNPRLHLDFNTPIFHIYAPKLRFHLPITCFILVALSSWVSQLVHSLCRSHFSQEWQGVCTHTDTLSWTCRLYGQVSVSGSLSAVGDKPAKTQPCDRHVQCCWSRPAGGCEAHKRQLNRSRQGLTDRVTEFKCWGCRVALSFVKSCLNQTQSNTLYGCQRNTLVWLVRKELVWYKY